MKKWLMSSLMGLGALAAGGASPALAQEFELRLRQGYDGNVYEVEGSLSERVSAYYSRLDVTYVSPSARQGLSVIARPQAHLEWYPQSSSGNAFGGALLLRLRNVWRGEKSGGWRRKTTLDVDLSGEYERELFLKRDIREELRIGTIDPNLAFFDLPSRAEIQTHVTLGSRVRENVTVRTAAFARIREYVESSDPSVPGYSQLDAHEIGALLEVSADASRRVKVSGEATMRNRTYPNREARTSAGFLVPGQRRRFWYWNVAASADFEQGAVRNRVRIGVGGRSDSFEGYYSYGTWEVGDRLRFAISPELNLRLRYSYGQRNYDVFAPAGSPTASRYHDASADLRVQLARGWRLYVGPHYERTVSNDPIFEFERFGMFAEVRMYR